MDDWNLDEKPLGKWQYLQHRKSIILPKITRSNNNVGLTSSVGDIIPQFTINIEQAIRINDTKYHIECSWAHTNPTSPYFLHILGGFVLIHTWIWWASSLHRNSPSERLTLKHLTIVPRPHKSEALNTSQNNKEKHPPSGSLFLTRIKGRAVSFPSLELMRLNALLDTRPQSHKTMPGDLETFLTHPPHSTYH
jgi:hypothetical protein